MWISVKSPLGHHGYMPGTYRGRQRPHRSPKYGARMELATD